MHPFTRALALAASLLLAAVAARAQQPPPVVDFFDRAAMYNEQLAPDGRQLAMVVHPRGQRGRLVVVDTEKLTAKVVASFTNGDVHWVRWINDRRLVFGATGGFHDVTLYRAVNSDGTEMSEPFTSQPPGRFHSPSPLQDSDSFFWASPRYDNIGNFQRVALYRVDSRTRHPIPMRSPGDAYEWAMDEKGEPAAATVREAGGRSSVKYFDPATKDWRTLFEFDTFGTAAMYPVALGPSGSNTLYVRAYNGRDKSALHVYDLAKNQLDPQPLVTLADHDFDGFPVRHAGRIVGFRYTSDAAGTAWVDPAFKAIQDAVDKLLPGTVNTITSAVRNQTTRLLVRSHSDRSPYVFYLYDSATNKLTALGKWRPMIDPKQMARTDVVKYRARDGLEIPARLTLPQGGGKNLPMVVLVHTGAFTRGDGWGWSPEAQFLASRGYAVLQPETRGSRGFGLNHFKAGWKQWGLAMQDDIADGAKWAAQQGIADPARICIAGSVWGGYSALMGLVRDPGLYRCAVAMQAITDLPAFATNWQAFNEELRVHGIPMMVGDAEKDAQQLKETSPLHRAAQIRQPVFLAHWDYRRAVPFEHGSKMRDALKANGVTVDWVDFATDWKLDSEFQDTQEVWGRIEKFLARHLAKP
ncbi:alpha/beta hydrolase family protein [Ramlibacter albus]|uniref:S9 family peptidase n=1 Tax=Ramlibacter albus TaxID=2079448 RepID=A0A923M3Z7_9BURK|nr:prolyl oligopeptidase family serine peptidase [Ramlibacter albus]MBC5763441.1 S9 family peptidase [Ramlibacter albus]